MNESDEIGQHKRAAFLAAFALTGNITRACLDSEIARSTHYEWMKDDDYAAAFGEAREEAAEHLEAEARRRAAEGWLEPVWHQGVEVGAVRKFSDGLLMFLLKGAKPERYRENVRHEHQGVKDAPPISIVEVVKPEGV